MLKYNQIYKWIIGYNDTEGNEDASEEKFFQVQDDYAPDISSVPINIPSTPNYNDSTIVSIQVNEPTDAAGLYKVWIHYTYDNWSSYTVADITITQSYTFSETMLEFNQTYQWKIEYCDILGNMAETSEYRFIVVDTFTPNIEIPASQTTSRPEFNSSTIASTFVSEPSDASGLDTVWINYTMNDWTTVTIVEITGTQLFIFSDTMLEYGQMYKWIIYYNDTAGNEGRSEVFSFTVVDSFEPDIEIPMSQSTTSPEFNDTVYTSITVTEPFDASGLDNVWINYTNDNWVTFFIENITSTQSFSFNASLLRYGQIYHWVIGYNDSAGNVGYSDVFTFIVVDTYAPDVETYASQTTTTPEFNSSVVVSIEVTEPNDASGLNTVWLQYTTDDWNSVTTIDITATQSFSFSETMLEYNQTYKWIITFNDTANNVDFCEELSFIVIDSYAPDLVVGSTQSEATPEFNETVVCSIQVTEPADASGLDKVWINYTVDNWQTYHVIDITSTKSFTFTEAMLRYDETYHWIIGYNDTVNNRAFSDEKSFTVIDSYAPDVISPVFQTTSTPEFNGTVDVSIIVSEPADAAGINMVWLNYTTNNWNTYSTINITRNQVYTFSAEMLSFGQAYRWIIGYNDTYGNSMLAEEISFTVVDNYRPDVTETASQSTDSPEYNETVTVSITVAEPIDASGLDTIWINYTTNDWNSSIVVDISSTQSFIFTENMLTFGQDYLWFIGYNDTGGNTGYSQEFSFSVLDSYVPDLLELAVQSNEFPEFNGTVDSVINVSEPIDAAGIDMVWINYTIDNWQTYHIFDITQDQSFTFTDEMLTYGEIYHWIIGYNDSVGNSGFSSAFTFEVIDTYYPDIFDQPDQTTNSPEYDDSNTIFITLTEPTDASGLETILLYYRVDNGIWNIEDVTSSSNYLFTPEILSFDQEYDWYFWFNDTVGNSNQTTVKSFIVVDYTPPTYSNLNQTNTTPEYYENNTVSTIISEPSDASGINTILLYYRVNSGDWITKNCTITSNYTFTEDMLSFGQIYDWYFWFNDTAGNSDQSTVITFTVIDNTVMEYSDLEQTTDTPLYNESNTVSVRVHEPANASGIDTILLYYRVDSGGWNVENCTVTSNYTFSPEMLYYDQEYTWYFWFNDTAGNNDQTNFQAFTVIDTIKPDIIDSISQTTTTPEFNGSVETSIWVTEPIDASNVDMVWINYTVNDWGSFTIEEITTTQSSIFSDIMLRFGQTYQWKIGFNDTAGNIGFSEELSFVVIDSYTPDIVEAGSQTTTTPEYNSSVTVSITVTEPTDASGINTVWLNYTRDDWQSFTVANITETQSFIFNDGILVFNQIYRWIIGFNDTTGNIAYSEEQSFRVIDSYEPDVIIPAYQDTSTPEFNASNIITIKVNESLDASGLGKVVLNYSSNDWDTYTAIDITLIQSYTITDVMLKYGQTYRWYITYNDTEGNTGFTDEFTFVVVDSYAPDLIIPASQSSDIPEYNDSTLVSITVTEPSDGSGMATVWINYTSDDWLTFDLVNITQTQSFTFTAEMLKYGQLYKWIISYNDTVGNTASSKENSFTVLDNFIPQILNPPTQTTASPEYNGSVEASIGVEEPSDASGVDTVWINYTSDNWITFTVLNITTTQNFVFVEETLSFNQEYRWIIGFNDTQGNTGLSDEFNFTVVDSYSPDVISSALQSTNLPEYNGTVKANITVTEPGDACGLDKIWLSYTIDNWQTSNIVDITLNQYFVFNDSMLWFNQTYQWIIGYNDTNGNNAASDPFSFTVVDNFKPAILEKANQTSSNPEYDAMNIVDISLSEPSDASGLNTILLHYRVNQESWIIVDVSLTSNYSFTPDMLSYDQVYEWYFWFNDSAGNFEQSETQIFLVRDVTSPTYSDLHQTSPDPQYNELNIVSLSVIEPLDASGVSTILLYYRIDFNDTWSIVNVTGTSQYIFTEDMLSYGQVYDWYFWFNDTAGNSEQTPIKSFMVSDYTKPYISHPFDQTLSEGVTGVQITWESSDVYTNTYRIFQNGFLIDTGDWNTSSITVDISGHLEGDYNYTLQIIDEANNWEADTVWVSVVKHYLPPSIGDWIVENHTLVLKNDSLSISGNLVIMENANLTLQHSTLSMNSTYDGQYRIEINSGGSLLIKDNSIITSTNSQAAYYLKANKGSYLLIIDSTITHAGYAPDEFSGLWINTDNAKVMNCIISNNYLGLSLDHVENCIIDNNTFKNNLYGILLDYSQDCFLNDNIILNNSNYGFFLNHSSNITLRGNSILNIEGELGNSSLLLEESGTPGFLGVGIFLSGSSDNHIADNMINNISGGLGGTGGSHASGGSGGNSAGIFLTLSYNNIFLNNVIMGIKGGIGGNINGDYGSGGSGGKGAGIFLIDSYNNTFIAFDISNVTGGLGGIGGGLSSANGTLGTGFGVYFEGNSYQNIIASSTKLDKNPIIYLYNQSDLIIEGLNLTFQNNPTNIGKIVLIECDNITITSNIISNYQGCNGITGGYYTSGTRGKTSTAIYLLNSTNISVINNIISSITGSTGGSGGYRESGGNGGNSYAIFLKYSQYNVIQNNTITDITGGLGGIGGSFGSGGTGGNGTGIYLQDSYNNSIRTNPLNLVRGGSGGAGGYLGSGGRGGIGIGIYLGHSYDNYIKHNAIDNIRGGNGGLSIGGIVHGVNGTGFGFYIEDDSYKNTLQNNTVADDPVIYLFGYQDLIIEDLQLTSEINPTNLGKIVLIDCYHIIVRRNNISQYKGLNGVTGGTLLHGSEGNLGVGIYLLNSSYCIFENNLVSHITGGTGGTGGWMQSGGYGGLGEKS